MANVVQWYSDELKITEQQGSEFGLWVVIIKVSQSHLFYGFLTPLFLVHH